MLYTGPPPQTVLDQRLLWQLLCFLLGVTALVRVLCLDIAGGMLSGLMLYLAVCMVRDGMREMSKYCLVYSVLCFLNFFFDALCLISELGGRVSRVTKPVNVSYGDEVTQTTFEMTTEVTPFFDRSEGYIYNMQSLSMVLSPISMGLGLYVALTASGEIGRIIEETGLDDNAVSDDGRGDGRQLGSSDPSSESGDGGAQRATARGRSPSTVARETFERFWGRGQKLPS